MFSDVIEFVEDFRLYCVSFWSDFYLWSHELSPEKLPENAGLLLHKIWIWYYRLPFLSQLILAVGLLTIVLMASVRIWTRWTSGVCKSKAQMSGKTVLVTGANSGEFVYKLYVYVILCLWWRGYVVVVLRLCSWW